VSKRVPLKYRERLEECQHRLPIQNRHVVLEQFECYFKVEQSISFKQLQREDGVKPDESSSSEEEKQDQQEVQKPELSKKGMFAAFRTLTRFIGGNKKSNAKKIKK